MEPSTPMDTDPPSPNPNPTMNTPITAHEHTSGTSLHSSISFTQDMPSKSASGAAAAASSAVDAVDTWPSDQGPASQSRLFSPTTPGGTSHGPILPEDCLRCILLPLYTSECSNKSFRHILSILDHLCYLPGSREVFMAQLMQAMDQLCVKVASDLDHLVAVLRESDSEVTVQKVTLTYFTPADAHQSKLLRVLKTVDYIHTKQRKSSNDATAATGAAAVGQSSSVLASRRFAGLRGGDSPSPSEGSEEPLHEIQDQSQEVTELVQHFSKTVFMEIWKRLNECLTMVQKHDKMVFVATVLLPLIECLMIVCKYLMSASAKLSSSRPTLSPTTMNRSSVSYLALNDVFAMSESTLRNHGEDIFFSFTEKHRKILNTLVRGNPKLLRGSFALLIKNAKVLEFDSKRNYFNQQLHKKSPQHRGDVIHVNVRRKYIFQDSYYQLQNRNGNELKYGKLSIRFHDEEGADYGGVSREWFQELTKEMFNPNYALFTPSAEKMGVTYQPNPSSWVNPSHLLYFKFVGRIIGKAIYDGRLIDCYFTRSVYKHMLGKPVDLSDMEAIDPEYHKSLAWMLDNSINDVLDLTFSTEMEEFGQQKVVDLKPDGRNIAVTDDNKHEYVNLIVENRLTNAIREQLNAFLAGFHEIVPVELVSVFNEKELELLISGVPDIDIDDWKNNTEYRGYSASSPQVQWFWRAVRSFDQEERAKLLQFTTGTSKVPLEGFKNLQGIGGKQKFQIHKDFGKTDRLPTAHTCFNQLDVPVYESYEQLKERLLVSITEGAVGFGFE